MATYQSTGQLNSYTWVEMLWIPAYAGMTEREAKMTEKPRLPRPDKSRLAMTF